LHSDSQPTFFDVFRSNFELVSTFRGHRSPVIFLDWSEDGAYIQSCDERGGFMYWDSMSGVQVGYLRFQPPFFRNQYDFPTLGHAGF
jgi:WD40 repeat protein